MPTETVQLDITEALKVFPVTTLSPSGGYMRRAGDSRQSGWSGAVWSIAALELSGSVAKGFKHAAPRVVCTFRCHCHLAVSRRCSSGPDLAHRLSHAGQEASRRPMFDVFRR